MYKKYLIGFVAIKNVNNEIEYIKIARIQEN